MKLPEIKELNKKDRVIVCKEVNAQYISTVIEIKSLAIMHPKWYGRYWLLNQSMDRWWEKYTDTTFPKYMPRAGVCKQEGKRDYILTFMVHSKRNSERIKTLYKSICDRYGFDWKDGRIYQDRIKTNPKQEYTFLQFNSIKASKLDEMYTYEKLLGNIDRYEESYIMNEKY